MLGRLFFIIIFQVFIIENVVASTGDRSQYYNQCLINCRYTNCDKDEKFKEQPPLSLRLTLWSCMDDCSYNCIWETVNYFTSHGLKVPQFHGKWPFIRLFGCQEPASVLFSILNFYMHLKMYWKFKRKVKSTYPMAHIWTFLSLVCLNGWIWSSIFHARDTAFTEVMDYSCAFVMVLTLLYCMLLRATYRNNKLFLVITCAYLSTLYTHLSHLWSGYINYGYNMKFNIVIGFITFVITMLWWNFNKKRLPYAYLIGWFNILSVTVTLLEVADFPPLFWTFDAHSLWHACTAPLTVLLYNFMISDCIYLNAYYSKAILDIDHHLK